MPKRLTRKTADAIVVSLCPDVCKTKVGSSVVPVPYPLFATFADAQKTSPNVNMQSTPAFNIESYLPNVTGNEAGKMGGVKSGVNKGIVNLKQLFLKRVVIGYPPFQRGLAQSKMKRYNLFLN